VKEHKCLGPIDRIPLKILGSGLQYLLDDTSDHLSNTAYQLGPNEGGGELTA